MKGFSLVHINIRSLNKNHVEMFLRLTGVDIITVSETWLAETFDSNLLKHEGYTIYRQDRNRINDVSVKKKGGGLCCYVKNQYVPYVTVLEQSSCTSNCG